MSQAVCACCLVGICRFARVEDAAVKPVQTDDDGSYSLTAYEGSYTVKVSANGYYSSEFSVDLKGDVSKDIELDPFIGYPGEIGYDDGTGENAWAFYESGNGVWTYTR